MRKLFFKEKLFKITDHYPILDEGGREEYYVDQDFTFIGYKSKVSDKSGREIFNINRKIISFLPHYYINFADGNEMTIKKNLSFFKKSIDVQSENEILRLNGDVFSYNFEITNGAGKPIGGVQRTIFALTDTYQLDIYDLDYEYQLIALVICLNNILDLEQAS